MWKPIDTVPKDGTLVLVCTFSNTKKYYNVEVGYYGISHPNAPGKPQLRCHKGNKLVADYWMPLPKDPKGKVSKQKHWSTR